MARSAFRVLIPPDLRPMQRALEIDGVRLALSQPHDFESQWIGQGEILKQLLACWMVVKL